MSVMRARGLVLAVAVVGAACASGIKPEALRAWVGRPAAELERDWGAATREVPDGELRILVYEEVERRTSRNFETSGAGRADAYAAAAAAAQEAYRIPTVYVRSYLFWVNRDGTIVNSMVRQP
jgi:hypothetical protein